MTVKSLLIAGLVSAASVFAASAWAGDVYVNGYFKDNGTYVQPHYRSAPDSSYNNNWSVTPNVNPYTGQQGLLSPTWNNKPPDSGFGGGGYKPFGGSSYGSGCPLGSYC